MSFAGKTTASQLAMKIHDKMMKPSFELIFHCPMVEIANGFDDSQSQAIAFLLHIARTETTK